MTTSTLTLTGPAGSGKTSTLHMLIDQIAARRDRAIVVDPRRELSAVYGGRPGVTIVDPADGRYCAGTQAMAWCADSNKRVLILTPELHAHAGAVIAAAAYATEQARAPAGALWLIVDDAALLDSGTRAALVALGDTLQPGRVLLVAPADAMLAA